MTWLLHLVVWCCMAYGMLHLWRVGFEVTRLEWRDDDKEER